MGRLLTTAEPVYKIVHASRHFGASAEAQTLGQGVFPDDRKAYMPCALGMLQPNLETQSGWTKFRMGVPSDQTNSELVHREVRSTYLERKENAPGCQNRRHQSTRSANVRSSARDPDTPSHSTSLVQ